MSRPAVDPDARRERTLLVALLLSAWAPFVTGWAVVLSRSTTQVADFVRRTVELAAVAVAWAVFRRLRRRDPSPAAAARLERASAWAVAAALAVSGGVTLLLALRRDDAPGGDVRLGLGVAVLGLLTNAWFWRRYARFARERPGRLMRGQRTLYRAKVAVDACVIAALATVALAPARPVTRWVDLAGSLAVAAYLLWSAGRAVADRGAGEAGAAGAAVGPAAPRRG